ncbi:MAG: potassium transporter TrkG [Pseudomonadota bacterium]
MLAILFYFAIVGCAFTLSLSAPILIALLSGELGFAARFGFYLLIGGFLFGSLFMATYGRVSTVPQVGRLVLLVLVWTAMPALAAIILWDITALNYLDALFDTISAITTSGASLWVTLEDLPQSVLFWRVQMQWMGGYLALLSIILVIAPMRIGGLRSRTETITNGADLRSTDTRLSGFAGRLLFLYTAATAVGALLFFLSGNRAFHAVTLSMTATSTGGFLPFDGSLDTVLTPIGLAIFAGLLLAGATSVFWHRMVVHGQWRAMLEHRESYAVLILAAALTLIFIISTIRTGASEGASPFSRIVEALVNAAALISTSGIESRPGYFTLLPLVLVLFVVFLGGSAFSTSGGLKHYRMGGMVVQSWSELDRLVYPHVVRASHFGSERYDIQLMRAIWSFFIVAILVIAVGTIVVAAAGIPFDAALTSVLANFATAGPVYGAGWSGPSAEAWPAYSAFPDLAKMALIAVMILGRLEVLAVLGLFSLRYWRSR